MPARDTGTAPNALFISLTSDPQPSLRRKMVELCARWPGTVSCLDFSPHASGQSPAHCRRIPVAPYAALAQEVIQKEYPAFLFDFAKRNGLLTLWNWEGVLSLWWTLQISEMSPLRAPLIDLLYRLEIVRAVLEEARPQRLFLLTDDPLSASMVRQLAVRYGASLERTFLLMRRRTLRQRLSHWQGLRRTWFSLQQVLRWVILKGTGWGRVGRHLAREAHQPVALFCTLYPTLWRSTPQEGLSNRSFGEWPRFLQEKGYTPLFAAVLMLNPLRLLLEIPRFRRTWARSRIVFLEAFLTPGDLSGLLFQQSWIRSYRDWKRRRAGAPALFRGIEVSSLLLRQIEHDLKSPEVAFNLCAAQGFFRLAGHLNPVALATHPFEYQPLEKAFAAALRLACPKVQIIGFQTGLTGRNHLGYWFTTDQARSPGGIQRPELAPLPDWISVNGTATLEILRTRFDPDQLILTGPIRLQEGLKSGASPTRAGGPSLAPGAIPVLIATSISEEESMEIVRLAFQAAARLPRVLLLIRPHPLCSLRHRIQRLSQRLAFYRYRLSSDPLPHLLRSSKTCITGTTSAGVEAISHGCMPILYQSLQRYDLSAAPELKGAAFFFHDAASLGLALEECLQLGEAVRQRRQRWPQVLDALCLPHAQSPEAVLYQTLLRGEAVLQ